MATNAVYKIYNGSSWVEYYLKTSAAQVVMTNARKFITSETKVNGQAFTLGSSDNTATVTINGTHITGSAAAPSGHTLTNISASDTVAAALGKLDKGVQDAKAAVPSGVLTTDNYAQTLGSVYAAIGHNHSGVYQPLDADLTAIANISTNGYLKRTGANTWAVEDKTFVETSRTINGKALSSNVVLYATDIYMDNSGYSSTISSAMFEIEKLANGHNLTLVLDYNSKDGSTAIGNGEFNSQADTITLPYKWVSGDQDRNKSQVKISASSDMYHHSPVIGVVKNWNYFSLKIGDVIYVSNSEVPDRWVSAVDTDMNMITFSKLETAKPDMSWNAITGKPTTLGGYGITDAKIENGVITLGSNTIKPLTSHQDISGKAPNNHASSATTYGLGTSSVYGHVKLVTGDLNGKSAADGMAASQSHTHSQYLTSHQSLAGYATQTWVGQQGYVKCTAGGSAPSSPNTGDIWIDTNN